MYCIYAKGNLTKDQCRKADKEIKSGFLEVAYDDVVTFHGLKKEDINSARKLLWEFKFKVQPEIYLEITYGCITKEIDVTDRIERELRIDELLPKFQKVVRDFDPYNYEDNKGTTNERQILEEDPLMAVEILVEMLEEVLV